MKYGKSVRSSEPSMKASNVDPKITGDKKLEMKEDWMD